MHFNIICFMHMYLLKTFWLKINTWLYEYGTQFVRRKHGFYLAVYHWWIAAMSSFQMWKVE